MQSICTRLFSFIIFIFLISCGSSTGGSSSGGGTALGMDQVSTVPLINGKTQEFYVYATNNGTSTMSNIEWGIDSSEVTSSSSILQRAKAKLKNALYKTDSESQAIVIKDTSECENVATNQSCRILLQVNSTNANQLYAMSGNQKIALLGGAGVLQSDVYTPINTGDLADMLSITPLSEVSYSNGTGSSNFFIINNGESSVQLDIEALKANFPANVSLSLGNCPNPVPGSTACQVRVVITNPTNSTNQELNIPLILSGEVINSDGSTTILPKQNGDTTLKATNKVKGLIQYPTKQTVLIDNSYANVSTSSVNGMISNSGSGSLTINSLVPNGEVLSIANDTCSGKTLGQGDTCSYTINLAVAKITNSNNELISINYIDEAGGEVKSVTSSVDWIYIAPLPLANPEINMVVNSNKLTQANPIAQLSVTNTGNVALSNISIPTITPANSRVIITNNSNNSCSDILAVGATCSFIITYSPEAPSETAGVTLSAISAAHSDNRGNSVTTTFNNSLGINISSIFEGLLTSSSVLALNESTSTGVVKFTNTGNYTVTVSNVLFASGSSANLVIDSNTCIGISLAANASCDVNIKLNSIITSGSGHGNLEVVYDNHNGANSAASNNSNINWLIGNAPSLEVVFANNSLVTAVGIESTTMVTLKNNGRYDLTNIVIPAIIPTVAGSNISYVTGTINGCKVDGTQSLAIGSSCTLILKAHFNGATSSFNQVLPAFGANYDDGGTVMSYATGTYQINLTALSLGDLGFDPDSIIQSVSWANNTQTSLVLITNIGQIPVTLGTISSDKDEITVNGCAGQVLQPLASCTLNVVGNYTSLNNKIVNGVLTVLYTSTSGSHSEMLNVTANYQAMPVVSAGLIVTADNFLNQNTILGVNESKSYAVNLDNITTATNGGVESITIAQSALKPSNANGVTYSLNTTGIVNNPCNLNTDPVLVDGGTTCNYHIVIQAGNNDVANTTISWNMNYSYYNYVTNSLIPDLTQATLVPTNSFGLTVTSEAQLSVAVVSGQSNNFDAIENGISPNPTIELKIKNTGTGAVSGAVTTTLPSGITGDFSSCNNLGVNNECLVTLTMSTTNVISAANLNTVSLSYNNRQIVTTADFPSIPYSVITPLSPAITMVESVVGCFSGDGTSNACMNNPDNNGGNASAMKVRLTFTNTSTIAATSLSLPSTESDLFTTPGYTLNSNTCVNGVPANNGTCVMEYSLPASAATQAINPDITAASFKFNYSYTSAQSQGFSVSGISNLGINIDVVSPVLVIGAVESITQTESRSVATTVSNLYQSNVPAITLNVESPSSGDPLNITTTAVNCNALVNNGATCSGFIVTNESTPALDGYKVKAVAQTIGVSSSETSFNVVQLIKKKIFVTESKWSGNLGGFVGADDKCNNASNRPQDNSTYKALLYGNDATTPGVSYYQADGVTFIVKATITFLNLNSLAPNDPNNYRDVLVNTMGVAEKYPWTGFDKNNSPVHTKCYATVGSVIKEWSSDSINDFGEWGYALVKTISWGGAGSGKCNIERPLYCAEQ